MKRLSLLEGEFHCCGTLCDKHKAQQHIDRMHSLINRMHRYLTDDMHTIQEFEQMLEELEELKTEIEKDV